MLDNAKATIIESVIETLNIEAQSILDQIKLVNDQFPKAIEVLISTKGKIVVTGMGKSGIIGRKISSTLSSTGTPSFFLHPAEAYHGDLGMVSKDDTIILISNSGETDEVLRIIPYFKSNGNRMVSITGNHSSTLAINSDAHLLLSISKEACPLRLAPTTSTTVTLAIGDAIAVCLMKLKKFEPENFARFHPGGSLGRRLLTKVRDVMRTSDLPIVDSETGVLDILKQITKARMGIVAITKNSTLIGIITDGDLRRYIERVGKEIFNKSAKDIMTKNPKILSPDASLTDLEDLMISNKIHSVPIVNEEKQLLGIVELYDTTK